MNWKPIVGIVVCCLALVVVNQEPVSWDLGFVSTDDKFQGLCDGIADRLMVPDSEIKTVEQLIGLRNRAIKLAEIELPADFGEKIGPRFEVLGTEGELDAASREKAATLFRELGAEQ